MNKTPDQLSQLIIEADALLLLLHHHREDTPSDAIVMLRKKLQLILTLIDGLEEDDNEVTDDIEYGADEDVTVTQQDVAEYIESTVEDEPQQVPASEPDTSEYRPGPEPHVAISAPRRPVSTIFNLNDKFRFRRELFGNSEVAYVEALDMLSAMHSLDEAKEYLYDDLEWDPQNEDVVAFIDLLTNYYKK